MTGNGGTGSQQDGEQRGRWIGTYALRHVRVLFGEEGGENFRPGANYGAKYGARRALIVHRLSIDIPELSHRLSTYDLSRLKESAGLWCSSKLGLCAISPYTCTGKGGSASYAVVLVVCQWGSQLLSALLSDSQPLPKELCPVASDDWLRFQMRLPTLQAMVSLHLASIFRLTVCKVVRCTK